MRRAARVLDGKGRASVYRGFVRPLMECSPLTWMGAAPTHLARLDSIQRTASRAIGPGRKLDSLTHRRAAAGLTYLYKLHCDSTHPMLRKMVPPMLITTDRRPGTRLQSNTLKARSLDNALRSFPFWMVDAWNLLPCEFFSSGFTAEGLQTFRTSVHKHPQ